MEKKVQYFVKVMNQFGVIVYISDGIEPFVFDIKDAMLFDTKDEAKEAIALVKPWERRTRYQKIGKRMVAKEVVRNKETEFYIYA